MEGAGCQTIPNGDRRWMPKGRQTPRSRQRASRECLRETVPQDYPSWRPNIQRGFGEIGRSGGGRVLSWDVNTRTCYACEACQPRKKGTAAASSKAAAPPKLFNSHCAGESLEVRAQQPTKLKVA